VQVCCQQGEDSCSHREPLIGHPPNPEGEDVQIQLLQKNAKQRKAKYRFNATCGLFSAPNDYFKLIYDEISIQASVLKIE